MTLGILSNELISLLTWTEKIYTCLLIKIREKIMNKGKERKKCYVDLKKEFTIYKYVCRRRIKFNERKSLNDLVKFDTHNEWIHYVVCSNKVYSKDELEEFRAYLIQRQRNINPSKEYWSLSVPVCMTIILDRAMNMLDVLGKIQKKSVGIIMVIIIGVFVIEVFIVGVLVFLIKNIGDYEDRINFYKDYISIIENMIKKI